MRLTDNTSRRANSSIVYRRAHDLRRARDLRRNDNAIKRAMASGDLREPFIEQGTIYRCPTHEFLDQHIERLNIKRTKQDLPTVDWRDVNFIHLSGDVWLVPPDDFWIWRRAKRQNSSAGVNIVAKESVDKEQPSEYDSTFGHNKEEQRKVARLDDHRAKTPQTKIPQTKTPQEDINILYEIVSDTLKNISPDQQLDDYSFDVAHALKNFFPDNQRSKEMFINWVAQADSENIIPTSNLPIAQKAKLFWDGLEGDTSTKLITADKIFEIARNADKNFPVKVNYPCALYKLVTDAVQDSRIIEDNIEKIVVLKRWLEYQYRGFWRTVTDKNIKSRREIKKAIARAFLKRYPEFADEVIISDSIFSPQDALEFMNERHAVIETSPKTGEAAILDKVYNLTYNSHEYKYKTKKSLDLVYANTFVQGSKDDDLVGILDWWLAQPNGERRQYNSVIYWPGQPKEVKLNGKTYLNEFEGFAIEPRKGAWKLFLGHIYKIVADKNPDLFKYIVRRQAWKLQNPDKPVETVLVMRGPKGAGKGLFADQFVKIWGRYAFHSSKREQFVGDFSGHLENKTFVFCDEAYFPGDKKIVGVINDMVTGEFLKLRKMRTDTFSVPNTLDIIMASNEEWIVPATDDERRYAVTDINPKYIRTRASEQVRMDYFTKVRREMDAGGRAAMMFDLLRMDLKGFHPRWNVPITKALLSQIELSARGKSEDQAILEALHSGEFPSNEVEPNTAQGENGKAYKFYFATTESILKYTNTLYAGKRKMTSPKLAPLLEKLGCRRGKNKDRSKRGYIFGELNVMRAEFEVENGTIEWRNKSIQEWIVGNDEPMY